MTKILIINPDTCTSCRLCELACSQHNLGLFRPAKSRIRVAIDAEKANYLPRVCFQCEEAHCIEACPSDALVRDAATNVVTLIEENCVECDQCAEACPYDAIDCSDGIPLKCEQCGGDPECVQFCAPGALQFASPDAWPQQDRKAYAENLANLAKEA